MLCMHAHFINPHFQQTCGIFTVVSLSHISTPCILSAKSCRSIFIPRISSPPGTVGEVLESIKTADLIIFNHLLYSQRCLLLVKTPTQSSSRSPWWNGSARMKPASTEPLKHFSIDRKRVCEWCQKYSLLKGQTCEHLESVAAFAVANPSWSSLSLCGRGTRREGVIARENVASHV